MAGNHNIILAKQAIHCPIKKKRF